MKILLIDHHDLFREGLRHVLQRLGGVDEILEAKNLSDGLKLARLHQVDLVLLELKLPGNRGVISVKPFRQHCPQVPVVVVSGEEDCGLINNALNDGASGYVCKSSTGAILLGAVHLALSGGVYVPPQLSQQSCPSAENANHVSGGRHSRLKECCLTKRQIHVLRHLASGRSNKEIAGEINLSVGTVKAHVQAVYQALRVNNRMQAKRVAMQLGLSPQTF